ncbi:bifunctional diguanylate cyclase/phosphodiesterase [Pseudorhizobium endolithicum]|uniref:Bifunctional diguanylate cyclase/phosphodiesterase n=1 Tax=Pseudorhizobium endolithicum TaxID=1191678 RepID=A0ABM8PKM5_9HYPH|nr:bifunctional diguanylate cyclase/phosphodiesterase [Pseudorhizobium endolithicum]
MSKLQIGIAHDQESATVWDDAVVKTREADHEWMEVNLGSWMNSYFQHDALVVIDSENQPIYHFIAGGDGLSLNKLRQAYQPQVARLRERLTSGDETGVTDQVLTIGESDLIILEGRPAVVSAKPIVSDTGDIEQEPGQEHIHVAFRFLDGSFTDVTAKEYQLDHLHFSWQPPEDGEYAAAELHSRNGNVIGYFLWTPFQPGRSVFYATLPSTGIAIVGVFVSLGVFSLVLQRRSVRLEASHAQLRHLAHHDPLTGLLNRVGFSDAAIAELDASNPDEPSSILFIDLDRFKEVNDTFGHPVGDELITAVAVRLRHALPGAVIGRIGGDEFTALLPGATGERAAGAAEQVIRDLSEPFELQGNRVKIGASVGVAVCDDATEFPEASRKADIALYHAKAAGRGRFAIFGKHMDDLLQGRRKMERELRAAIDKKVQIETVYQPVYAADTGALNGVEALARWRHPKQGVISPDVFVPLAEELGIISELGRIVLEQACEALGPYQDLTISINASPLELSSDAYPLHVLSTLAKFGVDPDRLEIEITESLQLEEKSQAAVAIATLRAAGVSFALDDFGAGYSSFGRLQNLHVDRIKIDKSFIDALSPGDSSAVVQAIISMARAKGLQTTAEGVETLEQKMVLQSLGCDALQGFLLSRPISRVELHAMLDRPRERECL